jgi:hypothetical protein
VFSAAGKNGRKALEASLPFSSHNFRHEMAITVLTPAIAETSTFSARLVDQDSNNDKLDLQNRNLKLDPMRL